MAWDNSPMPRLQIYVPEHVAHVLDEQARVLLLGRQQYIRAILCAVAQQARAGAKAEKATAEPGQAGAEPDA